MAALLVGPGARRLAELEERTKRRFFIQTRDDVHLDHLAVLGRGTVEELMPEAPVAEDAELQLELVEVGLHDAGAGIGKVDGYSVEVASAAKLVGKKVKAKVTRVLNGTAYATLLRPAPPAEADAPITAEAEAEKPTRAPRRKKAEAAPAPEEEQPLEARAGDGRGGGGRRGRSRGGRGGRRRAAEAEEEDAARVARRPRPQEEACRDRGAGRRGPAGRAGGGRSPTADAAPAVATIHVPEPDLGQPEEVAAEGARGGAQAAQEDAARLARRPQSPAQAGGNRRSPGEASAAAEPE